MNQKSLVLLMMQYILIVKISKESYFSYFKNVTIAASLRYLGHFQRSLKIQLINCNVELKLKLTNYRVLFTAGNKNDTEDNNNDANDDDIIFIVKDTNLYVPVVSLDLMAFCQEEIYSLLEPNIFCKKYYTKSEINYSHDIYNKIMDVLGVDFLLLLSQNICLQEKPFKIIIICFFWMTIKDDQAICNYFKDEQGRGNISSIQIRKN